MNFTVPSLSRTKPPLWSWLSKVNNSGPPADRERDAAVAEGIVINGLPIVNDRPTFGRLPPVPLDDYYRENVIGGDGSFMIVAEDFESYYSSDPAGSFAARVWIGPEATTVTRMPRGPRSRVR